jgi:Short C-terminal domain
MPLMDLFWTMLWFFLFIAWIWLIIAVIADVFRSRDLSGWGKGLWVLFVILMPWLGVLVYLVARGHEMGERALQDSMDRDEANRQYIQSIATSSISTADELGKLAALRDSGVLSADEFEAQKAKLLAQA